MADSNTPELVEVDLPAGKVKVDKATADILIKSRDTLKGEARAASERLGAIEAEKRAANEAAEKARQDAEIEKAAKNGEVEKIKQFMSQRENKLAEKYRDRALEAELRKHPSVLPEAVSDIAQQLRSSCQFNLDADTMVVVGQDGKPATAADGKPMGVDAFIAEFIEKRPYFRKATQTPGSGAAGNASVTSGKTMSQADWERLNQTDPKASAKFFQDGGKLT